MHLPLAGLDLCRPDVSSWLLDAIVAAPSAP
ncbi:hypothetical protein Q757_09220 [Oenococcus alcoholitolerans]|uniref:Uncharacterized protein n=1 Tax=Oenococcus alcoholitolerans TaxID=931074 RepID=A0ABR4XNV4_9LACO|nr:hypothetical protein Q757_09220 [Oenococcus alcoholitolerans]